MQQFMYQPEVRDLVKQKTDQWLSPLKSGPRADMLFGPTEREYQMPYLLGAGAGQRARKALPSVGNFAARLGHDVTGTTLAGAGLGGLLGAGVGLARGDSPGQSALLGAGGLGLVVFLLNRLAQMRDRQANTAYPKQSSKSAFYSMGDPGQSADPLAEVSSKLFSDFSLSSTARAELLKLLPQLSASEAKSLSTAVRSASGAGIGYLVARFLLGLGFTGRVLMSLAGAYSGFMSGGNPTNAHGQAVDTRQDVFGRARRV